jgi:hypothetical protein
MDGCAVMAGRLSVFVYDEENLRTALPFEVSWGHGWRGQALTHGHKSLHVE